MDILQMDRPVGTYNGTLELDPDGGVPECPEVDTAGQVALFSFDVI